MLHFSRSLPNDHAAFAGDVDGRQSDGIITSSERWMYLLKISSALRPFVTIMPILLLLMRLSISFGTTSVIALSAEPVMRQDAIVSRTRQYRYDDEDLGHNQARRDSAGSRSDTQVAGQPARPDAERGEGAVP